MGYTKWTDEHKNRVTELGKQGLSSSKIAQKLFDEFGVNLSRRTVSRYLSTGHTSSRYDKLKKNTSKVKDVKRGTEIVINKDGSTTSSTTMQMTSEQAKDPEFVLRAHGFNPDDWDIVSARNNFWQQNSQENGLIVIEMIGDMLHSDKINSTETVSGTILEDVDMPKAIDEAMQFTEAIVVTALENANTVMIKSVGGNHDFDISYMFMIWIKERFKQAQVDVNNRYRTAYLLGHVLISIQHGNVNKKNPAQILANECRHLWGIATTTEIHSGHLHFDKTEDQNGVVFRQFSTPKPSDDWETMNGFVGANKLMYALEYNDDRLKVEHFI
ncbi:helix-turn-helix domain-containing protein [Leuconostoc mesenteroides]|uniref:helix-turn-helix domain-containing protein n=1 Tax=Leuconostoc mesenteroides TaxID=1245 RepID=UPI0021A87CB3|nr:helix-turn-helix domain-containing protein [Leuconostoc mesenteroides]MCT3047918.1 helix-turn-helix domain-containing protein [Leuconostoc mesenteroides]